MADVSPEGIVKKILGGEWNEPNFQRGDTEFQVRKIGALEEDSIMDDILEALGLSSVDQIRFLVMGKKGDPALEPIRIMAGAKLFLSVPKIKKKAIRDRMFAHVWYKNSSTQEKYKQLRPPETPTGQDATNENQAFQNLRGIDVQIVFYRSLFSTFRDSFSSVG